MPVLNTLVCLVDQGGYVEAFQPRAISFEKGKREKLERYLDVNLGPQDRISIDRLERRASDRILTIPVRVVKRGGAKMASGRMVSPRSITAPPTLRSARP